MTADDAARIATTNNTLLPIFTRAPAVLTKQLLFAVGSVCPSVHPNKTPATACQKLMKLDAFVH